MAEEAGRVQGTDMVVVRFADRTVKGYANRAQWPVEEDAPSRLLGRLDRLSLRSVSGDTVEEIALGGAKAVFFVKTFDGAPHSDLRFHDHLAPMECIWIRVTFCDGEVMEGIIRNTQAHVLQAGFFMAPIDSEANNWLIYVPKESLQNFQVLGLRPAPKSLLSLHHFAPPLAEEQVGLSTSR